MIVAQAWQSGETVGHCNLRLARGSAYGVMPDFSYNTNSCQGLNPVSVRLGTRKHHVTYAPYTGNDASKATLDIDVYPQINTVSTAAQFSNDDTGCKQLTAL